MNKKAMQPANRFSARPSAIVATALATMLLILASAGKAAEADNRITIFQLSRPAGSENSVLSILQRGTGNLVLGETQIDKIGRAHV